MKGSADQRLLRLQLFLRGGMLLVPLLLASCAALRTRPETPGEQIGIASWYGPKFHGRRTSSGEVFDMHQLTAAHRELPLGTWIEVTNLENGQSIQVRVNDRGPFVAGRVIDLSYAAASALGMVGRGLAQVRIRPLAAPASPVAGPRPYTLQVGSFLEERNAATFKTRLDALTSETYVSKVNIGGENYYRVRVGSFASREAALRVAQELASHGYTVIIMERE